MEEIYSEGGFNHGLHIKTHSLTLSRVVQDTLLVYILSAKVSPGLWSLEVKREGEEDE